MYSSTMPHPLIRLLRLHQPAGILLLLWPCLWSLALHAHGAPPLPMLALFTLGAVLMRSAGCIVNDIVDKEVDAQVTRTHTRPIASGEISRRAAVLLAVLLLAGASAIALHFGWVFTLWSIAALPLVVLYPFMKRITYWPQLFLGFTFNWGALLGAVAITGNVTPIALFLYMGGICWTLGYDTIYAYQDAADDALIGIKSTALKLGDSLTPWIIFFYALCIGCLSVAGMLAHAGPPYFLGVGVLACALLVQIIRMDTQNSTLCMRWFKMNAWVGWLPAAGALLSY